MKILIWYGDMPESAFDSKSVTYPLENKGDLADILNDLKIELEEADPPYKIVLEVKKMSKKAFEKLPEIS